MTTELTDEQIDRIAAKYSLPYSLHSFARELIEHDRAARIGEFPALPEPDHATVSPWDKDATQMVFFTAEQMRAYAAQAVEADRAARGVPDGWALDLKQKIKEAIRLSDTVGRSRGLNSYALNTGGVYKLVNLEAEIDAMLAAAPQPAARGVPDGWQIVPKVATTEMILALMGTGLRHAEYKSKAASPSVGELRDGYCAALAAAPQPAAQPVCKTCAGRGYFDGNRPGDYQDCRDCAGDPQPAERGVPSAPDPSDPADIIAGALSISRGHAIEMMREAVIAAQPDRHPIPSPDSTGLAVVDMHYHWRAIDAATQRGVKLLLINRMAGVATLGALGSDPGHWTHWAPLPTFGDRT